MSSAWLLTCARCSGGSALPSSGEFRRTWKLSWQWNSQLPERSGTHVIENVRPGAARSVTTRGTDVAPPNVLSALPSPRPFTSK